MNLSNRIYLDFNATAPIVPPVKELLAQSGLSFGNPSSVHATGKKARRGVNEVRSFLYSTFGLKDNEFELFFHSGATEGINTFVKGVALEATKAKQGLTFFSFASDHSCVCNQKVFLETLGHRHVIVPVMRDGSFDLQRFEEALSRDNSDVKLVNWTWVNNETGVVSPLENIVKVKEKYDLLVHVDGVQAPGKVSDWSRLEASLDAYTFSGHKFGAIKGSGFTFIKAGLKLCPLLNGGGQQDGLRSGTENTVGIFSLKPALEFLLKNYDFNKQNEATRTLENQILSLVGERGEVIGHSNKNRNGNTIYLLLNGIKAHTSAMVFDMAGIDLSNGSACSSGAVIPSRVLLSMGYDEDQAKSALRLSFSPFFNSEEAKSIWPKIEEILQRLLS
jgi:cysteine desulfurase